MKRRPLTLALAAAATGIIAVGCETCPRTFVSREHLIAEYNANAARVPRLWASARIQITLVDDSGLVHQVGSASPLAAPNGLLLLAKGDDPLGPHDFVLIGRKLGEDVFRLGSTIAEEKYYMWYAFGDQGQAWWGRHEFAGAPGVPGMLIDPNQLLAVLGLIELPSDLTSLPAVGMTLSRKPCAYVLTYIDRRPVSRDIGFRREVFFRWSDHHPRRPFMVNFFAADGRRVMSASLGEYKPVEMAKVERESAEPSSMPADIEGDADPPLMPTDIKIEKIPWPGRETHLRRIHIRLSDMTTDERWYREACGFDPPLDPADVIQVDKALDAGGQPE